ncbi:hypothetical protein Si070_01675 [Streptococcus infantarius subsp. infantarius]|uniref:hypothetical protein n=1 Tax=Streptococcus infantarius TaxID=102684 RepID=UPI001BDAE8F0|nr:hypothetical protein [Streptococcus infantarius]MBT0903800.1 hypothetical protein [Streptococcus infantarius subsp. infantarius]MBT0917713.1 hypothetical protein [Streptococcus infantarius subsp. infantarius]MCO4509987.1 hypothetical protein [Streptococcus infantarius subsp. infantarius]MCO4580005.1 hypothetical protein [Streptococcus infantarius subsp. infantarius]
MIRAELTLGGQLEVINFDVETKSEAIEKVWNTYGYLTTIERLSEVKDETDSVKPIDIDEPTGESGAQEGDILQTNE